VISHRSLRDLPPVVPVTPNVQSGHDGVIYRGIVTETYTGKFRRRK
jgi:hypothetical protein